VVVSRSGGRNGGCVPVRQAADGAYLPEDDGGRGRGRGREMRLERKEFERVERVHGEVEAEVGRRVRAATAALSGLLPAAAAPAAAAADLAAPSAERESSS
jgi:hypothetical protein